MPVIFIICSPDEKIAADIKISFAPPPAKSTPQTKTAVVIIKTRNFEFLIFHFLSCFVFNKANFYSAFALYIHKIFICTKPQKRPPKVFSTVLNIIAL